MVWGGCETSCQQFSCTLFVCSGSTTERTIGSASLISSEWAITAAHVLSDRAGCQEIYLSSFSADQFIQVDRLHWQTAASCALNQEPQIRLPYFSGIEGDDQLVLMHLATSFGGCARPCRISDGARLPSNEVGYVSGVGRGRVDKGPARYARMLITESCCGRLCADDLDSGPCAGHPSSKDSGGGWFANSEAGPLLVAVHQGSRTDPQDPTQRNRLAMAIDSDARAWIASVTGLQLQTDKLPINQENNS